MSRLEMINSSSVANSTYIETTPNIITREHLKSNYLIQVILTTMPLITGDFLAVAGAVYASSAIYMMIGGTITTSPTYLALPIAAAVISCFGILRLYPGVGMNPVAELRKTTGASLMIFGLLIASAWITTMDMTLISVLVISAFFCLLAIPLFRFFSRSIGSRCSWWGQPLIVFGGDEAALKLYKHYEKKRQLGFRPVAIVED